MKCKQAPKNLPSSSKVSGCNIWPHSFYNHPLSGGKRSHSDFTHVGDTIGLSSIKPSTTAEREFSLISTFAGYSEDTPPSNTLNYVQFLIFKEEGFHKESCVLH
jgi:hypothetical protein